MSEDVVAIQWGDISHAGAFFLGTLFGAVLTLRLLKYLTAFLKRERDE